jgi:hypothetical protein
MPAKNSTKSVLIGDLRKKYGADFAQGCADTETLQDAVRGS